MLINDFNHAIDIWIEALNQYSFVQLYTKPSPESWSMGQVYKHLIENTLYYAEQIRICLSSNDNEVQEASAAAKILFQNNDFPDQLIEGPPANQDTPQPRSKEELIHALHALKDEMNHLYPQIEKTNFKGKTKHPGLLYFNAGEWFQFAAMHFRHHLRQKKRIDEFLKNIP
jgi:hypothetical protein